MIFEGVDFCLGSSGVSKFLKLEHPFDYMEKGDVQLHAEGLKVQF